MVYGGFGAPTTLHRGVDPNYCLYYALFIHTHEHIRSLSSGIYSASRENNNERLWYLLGYVFSNPEFIRLRP